MAQYNWGRFGYTILTLRHGARHPGADHPPSPRTIMPILTFNKSSSPTTPDDVRINSAAIRFVEAARKELPGQSNVYVLGNGNAPIEVMDDPDTVVKSIGGLVAANRHAPGGAPQGGQLDVYVSTQNVSSIRPNMPTQRVFWIIAFTDGTELRIQDPLPAGL